MLVYALLAFGAVVLLKKGSSSVEKALPFFCFFVAIMPGEAMIKLPGLFNLNGQRVALGVLFLLYIFKRGDSSAPAIRPSQAPLIGLMLLTLFWSTISNSFSIVPSVSFKRMLSYTMEYYLLYWILFASITKTETVEKILFALTRALGLAAVFGVLDIYAGWSVLDLLPRLDVRADTVSGVLMTSSVRSTFPHPILFGGGLAVGIPLALYLANRTYGLARVLHWIMILLMFLCIYKTTSRGPWISLALTLILLMALHKGAVRKYLVAMGALSLLVLLIRPGIRQTLFTLITSSWDNESIEGASVEYRFALLNVALDALSKSPLREILGYGQGSFFYLELEAEFAGRIHRFWTCDSAWIGIMVESGFVGLLLMAALLGRAVAYSWGRYRASREGERKNLFLLLFAVQAGFVLLMTNVAAYGWGQNGHIMWILVALASASARVLQEKPTEAAEPDAPRLPRWARERRRRWTPASAPAGVGSRRRVLGSGKPGRPDPAASS